MRFWVAVGVAVSFLGVARTSAAQECRRSCRADESRDANGCCIPTVTTALSGAPQTIRCPAGSSWNDGQRRCVGHLVCPSGTHRDESRGCVQDVVACPTGSRSEEGRCVADITCPPNTTRQDDACVAPVACPSAAHLEGGRCVSSDVTCPSGSRPREGGGCVFEPLCPSGTRFVEGRGCLGDVVCPAGSHSVENRCVPDHVCLEGQQWVEGRECVSVCESHPNTQWDSTSRACVCVHGFTARANRCEPADRCASGFHMESGHCEVDIVCPAGYRPVRGVGCINPQLDEDRRIEQQARARADADEQSRQTREQLRRWTWGPAFQIWAGGGVYSLFLPDIYLGRDTRGMTPLTARSWAVWLSGAPIVGFSFSSEGLLLGASYYPLISSRPLVDGWRWPGASPVLHVISGEIGFQGPDAVHTPRVVLFAGGALGGGSNLFTAGAAYRSLFRIWRGLFVGFEVRGTWAILFASYALPVVYDYGMMSPVQPQSTLGNYGFGGSLFVGYSIH